MILYISVHVIKPIHRRLHFENASVNSLHHMFFVILAQSELSTPYQKMAHMSQIGISTYFDISIPNIQLWAFRYRRLRDIPLRAIPRALAVQVSGRITKHLGARREGVSKLRDE